MSSIDKREKINSHALVDLRHADHGSPNRSGLGRSCLDRTFSVASQTYNSLIQQWLALKPAEWNNLLWNHPTPPPSVAAKRPKLASFVKGDECESVSIEMVSSVKYSLPF